MVERTSYVAGTPSWVDLGSPDRAASSAFYGGLFGWTAQMDPRPEAGGYGLFTLRGKSVAGLGQQMNTGMPPFWALYISVADADATAVTAVANGATVIVAPMDVLEVGRMAVFQDPTGAFISIWRPKEHIGAALVNENGTFTWNELSTSDLPTAREFYTSVFGWGLEPHGGSDAGAIFTLNSKVLCGAHVAGDGEFPAWSIWFAVADCDASASRVTELGGSILMPPNDMDFGRGAVVADPHGAAFGIGTMNADADATTG